MTEQRVERRGVTRCLGYQSLPIVYIQLTADRVALTGAFATTPCATPWRCYTTQQIACAHCSYAARRLAHAVRRPPSGARPLLFLFEAHRNLQGVFDV